MHLIAEGPSPKVPQTITRRYVVDITQPVLKQNGILR